MVLLEIRFAHAWVSDLALYVGFITIVFRDYIYVYVLLWCVTDDLLRQHTYAKYGLPYYITFFT